MGHGASDLQERAQGFDRGQAGGVAHGFSMVACGTMRHGAGSEWFEWAGAAPRCRWPGQDDSSSILIDDGRELVLPEATLGLPVLRIFRHTSAELSAFPAFVKVARLNDTSVRDGAHE